jgi:hypothetical protein
MAKHKRPVPTPHDIFFRAVFQIKEVVVEMVQNYLPENLCSELDFDSFELDRDAFQNEELKQYFSDLVYVVRLKNGLPLRIALLFEHKSGKPSQHLPEHIQILNYKTGIWFDDRKQSRPPTFVYPVIIHHGKRGWHQRPFWSVFEHLPTNWRDYVDDIKYHLIDLSSISDEDIIEKGGDTFLCTAFLSMKHAFDLKFFKHSLGKLFNFGWVKSKHKLFDPFSKALFFYLENLTGMKAKEIKSKFSDEFMFQMLDNVTIPSVYQEGMEKGLEKKTYEVVINLIVKEPSFSDEEIADLAGTDEAFVRKCRQKR